MDAGALGLNFSGIASTLSGLLHRLPGTIAAPGLSQTQYYEYDATNRLKIAVEGAPTCPATSSLSRVYDWARSGRLRCAAGTVTRKFSGSASVAVLE